MKLLVITSEPITADHLRAAIGSDATEDAEVLVIAPALHESALRFWLSDADQAIARAQTVQQDSVSQLDSEGITATGDTGESEPMKAIADSLQAFPADRVALFIHPDADQSYRENNHRCRTRRALRPAGHRHRNPALNTQHRWSRADGPQQTGSRSGRASDRCGRAGYSSRKPIFVVTWK
jgi:hypothetical protein